MGLLSSLGGAFLAGRENMRNERALKKRIDENEDLFRLRYNEDATKRADVMAALGMTEERIRERNREAAGVSAVMGGGPSSSAAVREANARALSDVASSVAVNAERRKDSVEDRYLGRKDDLEDELSRMRSRKASSLASAAKSAGGLLNEASSALGIPGVL